MIMEDQNMSQRQSVAEANVAPPAVPLTSIGSIDVQHQNDSACCNVYVANLPPSANAQTIRSLFETVGKVLHVKLLLDIASGVSRGIAFVMFETIDLARRACLMKNKVVLDGNVLQVRLAERSSLHSSPTAHVRSSVVYIRNVPGDITHDIVKRYCEEKFGPVIEVSPHPQSCELKGPSPFNMDFVVFKSVDDACRCVEAVDGRETFPMPPNHPFTMAKMITDVAGEMRKSILLRRRSSDNQTTRRGSGLGSKTVGMESRRQSAMHVNPLPPPPNPYLQGAVAAPQLTVNPQFQPFIQPFTSNYAQSPTPLYQPAQGAHSSPAVPFFDGSYNANVNSSYSPYLDSQSHRSSLDTSVFQSQRGSLMVMNNSQNVPSFSPMVPDGGMVRMPMQSMTQHPQQFFPSSQNSLAQPHLMSQPLNLPIQPQQMQFGPQMTMHPQFQPHQQQQMVYHVPNGHQMNGR